MSPYSLHLHRKSLGYQLYSLDFLRLELTFSVFSKPMVARPRLGSKLPAFCPPRWAFATRPKNWEHWYHGNHQNSILYFWCPFPHKHHIWIYPMDYPHPYYKPSPAGKRSQVSVYVSDVGERRGRMRIAPRTPSAAGCRVHMVVSLLPQKNLKYKTIFK